MVHATSPTVGYGTVDVANALLAALMPVARCLDMRDATTGKVYDVEIKTIGSQFTTSAIAMRLARNSALVYSQVVGKWITEMAEIEAEADLHKGVYQRPVPVIQWAEPRKRAMQGFVRETCVQLARRLLERAAVAFLDASRLSQDDQRLRQIGDAQVRSSVLGARRPDPCREGT